MMNSSCENQLSQINEIIDLLIAFHIILEKDQIAKILKLKSDYNIKKRDQIAVNSAEGFV